MQNKVLVEVKIPAADISMDAYIPLESRLSEVLKLLSGMMSELSEGKYKAAKDAILCEQDSGIIYNINMEVAELGIRNGSKLLLI